MSDSECSFSRLAKTQKAEFTYVNEHFCGERNEENGHYGQTLIKETQDALDIMANSNYQGAYKIIVQQENLAPDFFDLKTGLAGEILQKFSTYNIQLAIVGDFSIYPGKSLKDFIVESNRHGRINFVKSLEEAKGKLVNRKLADRNCQVEIC